MQERNIITATTSMALMPFIDFYQKLTPFIILAIVLIIADSRFGVEAAQKRGEVIRQSRKWRRAINKLVDYICWISLAGVFSNAYSDVLGIPMLSGIVLLIVYAIEIVSCFNNYFEFKGINLRLSFNALFQYWFEKVSKSDKEIIEKLNDNDTKRHNQRATAFLCH
jgi:hypothetical protein